jgi:ribosomal protein S18 acetylase RimI-like enzyme
MKTEVPELVFEPFPSSDLERFLEDNVVGFNLARTGVSEWHPVGFFLRNRRGEWLGGCIGDVWGGWLHIRGLWVAEGLRGRRQGTRLMDAAEGMGLERGAANATLETHSFQAREFYTKRGYTVFGTLEDYPPGHSKFFLRKRLSGTRT